MKITKLEPSRFNTKTNWQRITEFMLPFRGDIILKENHRIVGYELCEKHGLVINLGQTSYHDEPNHQIIFTPEAINKGTIEAKTLFVSDGGGEEHALDFYTLVEAPIN